MEPIRDPKLAAEAVERAARAAYDREPETGVWADADPDTQAYYLADSRAALIASGLPARVRELEAIVAKLPKTADGVPIVPGMKLWVPAFDEVEDDGGIYHHAVTYEGPVSDRHIVYGGADWMQGPIPLKGRTFYSTREAAEAAKQEQPR